MKTDVHVCVHYTVHYWDCTATSYLKRLTLFDSLVHIMFVMFLFFHFKKEKVHKPVLKQILTKS